MASRQSFILDDRELKAVLKRVRLKGDSPTVQVGIIDGEIATYATINEFGAPAAGIPARPFMRAAFDENRRRYEDLSDAFYLDLIEGRMRMTAILTALGRMMQSDVRKKIRSGPFVANAPGTIAKKGSSAPLIDTGAMRGAIVYTVDADGSEVFGDEGAS